MIATAGHARCRRQALRSLLLLGASQRCSIFSFAAVSRRPLVHSERKVLRYSPAQLYDLVSDVNQYKQFVPFCIDSKILSSSLVGSPCPSASAAAPTVAVSSATSIASSPSRPNAASTSTAALSVPANTTTLLEHDEGASQPSSSHPRQVIKASLTVGFSGITESYVSTVICERPHLVKALASNSSLFTELITTWRFTPAASQHQQHTVVDFNIRFQFKNPLHASVANLFFAQVSKGMVAAFERRAGEVYGHGRRHVALPAAAASSTLSPGPRLATVLSKRKP
ncbi:hypothetical protein RI367_004002 [Sorochytrium milnesiophthora]